jgi:hypothetical protein
MRMRLLVMKRPAGFSAIASRQCDARLGHVRLVRTPLGVAASVTQKKAPEGA